MVLPGSMFNDNYMLQGPDHCRTSNIGLDVDIVQQTSEQS